MVGPGRPYPLLSSVIRVARYRAEREGTPVTGCGNAISPPVPGSAASSLVRAGIRRVSRYATAAPARSPPASVICHDHSARACRHAGGAREGGCCWLVQWVSPNVPGDGGKGLMTFRTLEEVVVK